MANRRSREPVPIAPKLARLSVLDHSPAEQRAFAAELVATETDFRLIQAALDVLVPTSDPDIARLLIDRYGDFDDPKVDQGGVIRASLARALRHVTSEGLAPVFERAVSTYEKTMETVTGDLRAAGLTGLLQIAPELATFHSIRFLTDPKLLRDDWWEVGGEPALTAVRILAEREEYLPLFAFALQLGHPEVRAEALRMLSPLPQQLAQPLVDSVVGMRDEPPDPLLTLGLIDLSITHPGAAAFREYLRLTLATEADDDLYSYLVSAIVASRRPDHLTLLMKSARLERKEARRALLRDALALVRSDPQVVETLRALGAAPPRETTS